MRYRRDETGSNLKVVGEIVLIGADDVKRQNWSLGKILELKPGCDGFSRVALVKTQSGEFLRSFQRLYPLEVSKHEVSELKEKELEQNKDLVIPNDIDLNISKSITTDNFPKLTKRGRQIKVPQKLCLLSN